MATGSQRKEKTATAKTDRLSPRSCIWKLFPVLQASLQNSSCLQIQANATTSVLEGSPHRAASHSAASPPGHQPGRYSSESAWWQHAGEGVITQIFLEKRARNKITSITPQFLGCRAVWLARRGWLHCGNCWCSSALCSRQRSFSSVVCCPQKRIHRFKSAQREELCD